MTDEPTPAAILARFPGPVILRPSRTRWQLVLAGCLGFMVLGGLVPDKDLGLWLAIGFFGLCAIGAALVLLPASSFVVLDAKGFETTFLYHRRRTCWPDVSGFGKIGVLWRGIVVYEDAARRRAAFAFNCGLPDTYGMRAEDLIELRSRWRNRAVAAQRKS